MTVPAIVVENLGKQYHLGQREAHRRTFREAMVDAVREPWRRFQRLSGREQNGAFWALRDVSFVVEPGEVLGIIGRNGAGKSTLLKVLSQITEPTEGRVAVRGRVASLLEVGTGFHNELTGRENVYLNGAILGMSKAEIDRKFDEIVAFAGVEKFLDTAIKHYSSGMKVRLAFAVAAHLEPEILVIDEVLAVGDARFRSQCMRKMGEVAGSGRTVFLVSHDMGAIESLSSRVMLLEDGRIERIGAPEQVIAAYLSSTAQTGADVSLVHHRHRSPAYRALARRLRILDENGRPITAIPVGSAVTFELELASPETIYDLYISLHLHTRLGVRVTTLSSYYAAGQPIDVSGVTVVRCRTPRMQLVPGSYHLVLGLATAGGTIDKIEPVTTLEITPRDIYGTGRVPDPREGLCVLDCAWEVHQQDGIHS
jgi:lipopolysaccharide transport system ATP-binding protein